MSMLAAAAAVLSITVRVYDLHGVPPDQRVKALAVAAQTLAEAKVAVEWVDCGLVDGVAPRRCVPALAEGELVLRFQDRTERGDHILGTAIVQDTGPCVLASVYASSVADRAVKTGLPIWLILGRVTAHEIGHLLLGTNSHALSGLMKASWNLRRPNLDAWLFTRNDAEKIRRRFRVHRPAPLVDGVPVESTSEIAAVMAALDASVEPAAERPGDPSNEPR